MGPDSLMVVYVDPLGYFWVNNEDDWGCHRAVLGGSWDLVTIYSRGYKPTYNWGNPYKAI